jgi:arabinan endo-1,5-alpha-L-arabinosidase
MKPFAQQPFFSPLCFAALSACILSAFAGTEKVTVYTNPLKGDIGAHDPVMTKQDSTYYVFYTGPKINIKTSIGRTTWNQRGTVFATCPSWFKTYVPENDGKDCWAPDISFRNNKYWLYYAVSTFGARVSAIGLATNSTLNPDAADYKWVDEGMIMNSTTGNNYNCIDPNIIVDDDNKVWMNFGSWNSGIKMVELNPETGKLLSSNPTIYSLASRTSTSLGIEAPFIIKRQTYYYLFVSWDVCCKGVNSTYNIRVGRASKITGPYSDQANTAMKSGGGTLVDAGDQRWKGPGHNGIFSEHDTIFLVNHAYDADDNGKSKLMIRPLFWTGDGWPTLDSLKGKAVVTRSPVMKQSIRKKSSPSFHPIAVIDAARTDFCDCRTLYSIAGSRITVREETSINPGIYYFEKLQVVP